jgi:hypothetical protein
MRSAFMNFTSVLSFIADLSTVGRPSNRATPPLPTLLFVRGNREMIRLMTSANAMTAAAGAE